MEVPRHWRLQKTRYGNSEGELKLAVCPVCGEKIFPPNRPFCTACNSSMQEKIAVRSKAVGVGALTFVATETGLKVLLFDDVKSNPSDDESKKRERVIFPEEKDKQYSWLNPSSINFGRDIFTEPTGINTVTGKVDNGESTVVLDFLHNSENYASLDFKDLPPAFVNALYLSMLREMEEEVPGLSARDLEDKVHLFSKSSFNIEQIRPIGENKQDKALYNFMVFVLAILIDEGDLAKIEREGWQLYSFQDLSEIDQGKIRKATLAVLDFLPAALLFLAEEGKIPQEELANYYQDAKLVN
ncbi:MAG: hypothetical protein GX559_03010 [Candidatus Pacebacteria bacterium]|nr:hypothetical protein [Candidatus Paceibacterota bacterium]